MNVQIGDIVLHAGRGWMSNVIRRVTKCPWSHVSLVVRAGPKGFSVMDVLDTRVIQPINAHHRDLAWQVRAPRYHVPGIFTDGEGMPSLVARDHAMRQAMELHGELEKSYPYTELLAYLPLFRRTALGRRILQRSDRLVCSAMVAAAWASMGFRWYNGPGGREEISPDWVGPGTMWRQAARDAWPVVCTKESFYA